MASRGINAFFYNKKGQEADDSRITSTIIIIILALIVFGFLIYWIVGRLGNVSLPQK